MFVSFLLVCLTLWYISFRDSGLLSNDTQCFLSEYQKLSLIERQLVSSAKALKVKVPLPDYKVEETELGKSKTIQGNWSIYRVYIENGRGAPYFLFMVSECGKVEVSS